MSPHIKNKGNYKHGMGKTPIWSLYQNIKQRCRDPNCKSYKWYGGKGISCEWATFEEFYRDMGDRPTGMTIERIDSKGNYGPGNCRWATPYEQSRNTSQNRWIEFNGKKQCLADWATEVGIKRTTLMMRLDYYGWSVERALTQKTLWGRQ